MNDRIENIDCNVGLDSVPDGSVDLIIMDPPYSVGTRGGGAFGSANRSYFGDIEPMSFGLTDALLEKIASKSDPILMYAFCNKFQIPQYIRFAETHGCSWDILAWHKTNPVPICNQKYLSDTEYIVFVRGRGAKLWGSYATKRKWWVTSVNRSDCNLYHHPTVKPLEIVRTLISNHIDPEKGTLTVLDPFMGSGTTAVACIELGMHYIGFEIDGRHFRTAESRIADARTEGASRCFRKRPFPSISRQRR